MGVNSNQGDVMDKTIKTLMDKLGLSEYKAKEAYKIVKESSSPKKEKFTKKDFREHLILHGCDPQHVDDWMKVRTTKKGSFTKTALKRLLKECHDNYYPVADAVRVCAENDWRGFKYEWIVNQSRNERNNERSNITRLASEILKGAGQ